LIKRLPGKNLVRSRILLSLLTGTASIIAGTITANAMPTGVFLLHPGATAPGADDCRDLTVRVRPSVEKAEAWYWGRAPFGSDLEFYMFLSQTRMETTFSAEGDYDTGELRNLQTKGDETTFDLIPDEHPAKIIKGSIRQSGDGSALAITLYGVPTSAAETDRVTYYCSFNADTQT